MQEITRYKISIIISGGQTGADRGGLDFAIENKIRHGGWCPLGRRAEDYKIPFRYHLKETSTPIYPVRTRYNIKDSDATLIFSANLYSKGTLLTLKLCNELHKPYLCILVKPEIINIQNPKQEKAICYKIIKWINFTKPEILNIAGSRESHCPGLSNYVKHILSLILEKKDSDCKWPPKPPRTLPLFF